MRQADDFIGGMENWVRAPSHFTRGSPVDLTCASGPHHLPQPVRALRLGIERYQATANCGANGRTRVCAPLVWGHYDDGVVG